jgi:steroid delta-isomerase-like uncharacterized protein
MASPAPLSPVDASVERNKAVVHRLVEEVFNNGTVQVLREITAPDVIFYSPTRPAPFRGPEGIAEFVTGLRTGFPDLRIAVEAVVAAGDLVAVRWKTTRQTHTGVYLGLPPTGRRVTMTAMEFFRLVDGRVAEVWLELDAVGGMRQLGVLPPPDAGPLRLVGTVALSVLRAAATTARQQMRRSHAR